ncbi:hypothetical protein Taro_006530 [Colocasia esculenta]|uniref:Uncharacterized protein n=1 Tax=Colocasia esculenta TaxID=4460 RepID=A0A843TXX0_COLES|nr:hypothetical protein [Colocasia esculenta]
MMVMLIKLVKNQRRRSLPYAAQLTAVFEHAGIDLTNERAENISVSMVYNETNIIRFMNYRNVNGQFMRNVTDDPGEDSQEETEDEGEGEAQGEDDRHEEEEHLAPMEQDLPPSAVGGDDFELWIQGSLTRLEGEMESIRGEVRQVGEAVGNLSRELAELRMASTGERSSRDGSRPRRLRTLSVPLPPTSQAIPPPPTSQGLPPAPTSQQLPLPLTLQQIAPSSNPQGSSAAFASSVAGPSARSWGRGTGRRGPTRGVTERRLPDGQQWNVSLVRGYGVGPTADHFTSRMGVVSKVYCKIWQKDFAKLPVATQELIFRDLQHFNGKPLDDAITSVPAGVDPSDWQTMCELWTTGDERSQMHGRIPHRLEVFKMGRCKDLPDGTESWVDEESRRRYEAMSEMIAPSGVDAES